MNPVVLNYVPVAVALALILFGVWCLASFVNAWEHRALGVPVTAKGRESKCRTCNGQFHNWKQVVLLGFKDIDKYMADPASFKSECYCLNCGYVPGRDLMLQPKFLKQLQTQEAAAEAGLERMRVIDQLKEDWFAKHSVTVQLTGGDITLYRQGYELYDQFVSVLPELYEGHLVAKALKENPVKLEVKA